MTIIRIEGADELIAKITSLESMQRVKASIHQVAIFLQSKVDIKAYPRASHRPNVMLQYNDRMRRGFFYHLNHPESPKHIEVPYRRGQSPGSQKLGQSWTTRTENMGFRAIIGTNVSYARLVQDSAKQTSYHRGTGWITTRQAMQLYGSQAVRQIQAALRREIES